MVQLLPSKSSGAILLLNSYLLPVMGRKACWLNNRENQVWKRYKNHFEGTIL